MAITAKQRKALLEKGRSVDLSPNAPKFQRPKKHDPHKVFSKVTPQERPPPADRQTVAPPADGRPSVSTTGRPAALPADRRSLPPVGRQTVAEEKKSEILPADGRPVVPAPPSQKIPLAPVQWRVWEAISQAEEEGRSISRRELASIAKATIRGVRDAMNVLEEAGGILSKETVRTASEQGIRFTLDHSISFRQASRKETLGITKRAYNYRPTSDGRPVVLPADRRPSMYVCKKNTYIQEEDIRNLLRVCPTSWKMREATLINIADMYPSMNATVFRLSLLRAVEQAQSGKKEVQNPNAWLKAAFQQNGKPLITERDLEAQLASPTSPNPPKPTKGREQGESSDMAVLRKYLAVSDEDRAEINRRAENKVASLLAQVGEDKREGIRVQAKIEAAREYFQM